MPPYNQGRPKKVIEAIQGDDHEALSAMGKKGAAHAAFKRELKDVRKAEEREKMVEEQSGLYSMDEEGNILPPEEKDLDEDLGTYEMPRG